MSNESVKTLVFPEGGTSNDALLLSAMNNGGFGGGMNNPFWAIILLAFLRNWGGFNGENGGLQLSNIQEQLNTIQGQNSLMSAITGGTNEVRSLANVLNADVNAVQAGINAIQSAICNVGNQVGMGQLQVINSIQSGNTAIANQIAQCCCDNKLLTTTQGYENRINNLQQSNMIQSSFTQLGYANADNTNKVIAKLDQIEDSRKDREISSLTAALTAANSRAERQAELAPIYKALADIECKQPNTVTIPYSPVTPVPSCVAWNAALYGGFPYAQQQGNVFS